jgi:lipopolysaccharide/colanic/teichoic acid biosynthesis glycosyltransferase
MRQIIESLVALAALIVLSPLLITVALAIVIDSPGNPMYFAARVGQNGKIFRMCKFRTMVRNAARLGPPITGNRDPRITRFGGFLRKTKIDELPQLVNVLLGHMALVGPRPEAPEIVVLYADEQRRVLSVKPGVTGHGQLAQLMTGEEADSIPANVPAQEFYVAHLMPAKVRSDLEYIQNQTLLSDTRVLVRTVLLFLRLGRRR